MSAVQMVVLAHGFNYTVNNDKSCKLIKIVNKMITTSCMISGNV